MGGIFLRNVPLLIISIICGYLYMNWLPIPSNISVYNIIMEFVFNPVMFFAATISFFIGFITNGIFIQRTILMWKRIRKYKGNVILELVLTISLFVITFFILMRLNFWPMFLFFSFAFVYGMMTIDKNK
jgi:hypothetical protein